MLYREGLVSTQHGDIVIHANELSYNEGLSTGDIIRYTFLVGTACHVPITLIVMKMYSLHSHY